MSPSIVPLHSQEEIAVLAVAKKFLGGMKARDPASMHACALPTSHAILIRPAPASNAVDNTSSEPQKYFLRITLAEVVDRIPWDSPGCFEENIALAEWEEGDDGDKYGGRKTEVRVDGDLAMVWSPYEVRKDGVLSHVGTNVFSFAKGVDGRVGEWVIVWVSDTLRRPSKGT